MSSLAHRRLKPVLHSFLKHLTNISFFFPGHGRKVPILAYHRVCPLRFPKEFRYNNVFPEEFEKQMKYLKANFEVITVSEYVRRIEKSLIKGDEICVTFDDGFKDNYIYALPILNKYRLKASFFLTTKHIEDDVPFPWMPMDRGGRDDFSRNPERWLPLSWKEVKDMMDSGMEFGTHTHTHRDSLSNLSLEDAKKEIEDSTRTFFDRTGVYPEVFSYPHGTFKDYSAAHIEILKGHDYKAALTTNIGRNDAAQGLFELKRIVVYEEDSIWEFKKKVHGAYDVAERLQKIWLNMAGSKKLSDYAAK